MTGMQLVRSKRGSSALIARELGISRGAVAMWEQIPAERVVEVERITGIPRAQLRPDLYAEPAESAA